MTKKQLVDFLSQYPDDSPITFFMDCIGNPLDGCTTNEVSIYKNDNCATIPCVVTLVAIFDPNAHELSYWMSRDSTGELLIWEGKPTKEGDRWTGDGPVASIPKDLFPEISWMDESATPLWRARELLIKQNDISHEK